MNITSWLVHTVTRKQRTGVGAKGDPTYGAATTFKARVEKTQKLVRTPDGKTVQASWKMATSTVIKFDDRFWLPAIAGETADDTTNTSAARTPISVTTATDKAGRVAHWECYF